MTTFDCSKSFSTLGRGNDHTSVVPEDWTGWLPPNPEEQQRAATANSKTGRRNLGRGPGVEPQDGLSWKLSIES